MTAEIQLDRLTNEKFLNPYDVLVLSAEAPDEEIRRQYRNVYINNYIIDKFNYPS
jgi:preprotein translocase subunit Sec63